MNEDEILKELDNRMELNPKTADQCLNTILKIIAIYRRNKKYKFSNLTAYRDRIIAEGFNIGDRVIVEKLEKPGFEGINIIKQFKNAWIVIVNEESGKEIKVKGYNFKKVTE